MNHPLNGNISWNNSYKFCNFSDQIKNDPCAFNMHGILMENQQLYTQAAMFYSWYGTFSLNALYNIAILCVDKLTVIV